MPDFYVLEVAHGNSAVLIDSEGVLVVDAGPKTKLLEFLLDNNIYKIDVLLLSHADMDHVAGVIGLLASGQIQLDRVYLNSDATKDSNIWNLLIYTLWDAHKKGIVYFEPSLTPHLNGKLNQGEVIIEVLAPNQYIAAKGPGSKDRQGQKLTSNSISAVIRLLYKEKSIVLLPGDIDQVGLSHLLEDNTDIQTWITVYPHHGGSSGSRNVKAFATQFCQAVKPEVIIFSIRDNERQFPTKEVIDTVVETLDNVHLFSTRSSEVLRQFIEKTGSELHQDGVGKIHLDLESLKLTFKGNE